MNLLDQTMKAENMDNCKGCEIGIATKKMLIEPFASTIPGETMTCIKCGYDKKRTRYTVQGWGFRSSITGEYPAQLKWAQYNELVTAGFSKPQAMQLIKDGLKM